MKKKSRKIWHCFLFLAVFAAIVALVMVLWNCIIPSVIGWNPVNYWQALGLMVLCKFLFGGFHGHHMNGRKFFHRKHREFHERVDGMSCNEKREYIRRKMAGFCDTDRNGFYSDGNDASDK